MVPPTLFLKALLASRKFCESWSGYFLDVVITESGIQ